MKNTNNSQRSNQRTSPSAKGYVGAFFVAAALTGCSSTPPANLGLSSGQLSPCPDRPNCVNSQSAGNEDHAIAPLSLSTEADWQTLITYIRKRDSWEIVEETDNYLRFEATSSLMGFVDDVELLRSDDGKRVDVRSASRLGYSDLGVNRDRVEELRAVLN